MKISLHDNDKTGFPNLALMKLSAWHKRQGHRVEWFRPILETNEASIEIYSSKIFTYTRRDEYLPVKAQCGGSGYSLSSHLSDEKEHECPDYDLYGIDYSLGFLTRGCIFDCEWCVVRQKEGSLRKHADIDEFLKHDRVVLLDNNILAHPWGVAQIEKISMLGIKVDFNQGLDARFIDDKMAKLLSRVKWLKPLRLACDTVEQRVFVREAVKNLRWNNVTPVRYFCYMLIRDIDEALEQVKFLKGLNLDPFAQPYRDLNDNGPTEEQKALARWINHKAIFKSVSWEEYKRRPRSAVG